MKWFWGSGGRWWEVTRQQQLELAYEAEGLWWLAVDDTNTAFGICWVRP